MEFASVYSIRRHKKYRALKNMYKHKRLPVAREKGWYVIYDSRLVDDLHFMGRIHELKIHLYNSYRNLDIVFALMERGYKDPMLHRCFDACGFYEKDRSYNAVVDNWEFILFNAIERYFKRDGLNYQRVPHVKFGTYLNASFANCFVYFFKDVLRQKDIRKKEEWFEFHEPLELIDESLLSYKDDMPTVNTAGVEFLQSLQKV